MGIRKLRVGYQYREVPKRGPIDSDRLNSSLKDVDIDLTNIANRYNESIYIVLAGLPSALDTDGTVSGRWNGALNLPDAFTDGLDGTTIFVDNDAEDDDVYGDLWNDTDSRPMTIKEAFSELYSDVDSLQDSMEITYLETYVGKPTTGSITPDYSTNYSITDGESLQKSIENLDVAIHGLSHRLEKSFVDNITPLKPIVWEHGQGVLYPLIQVIDLGAGSNSGVVADEVYGYEQEHSLPTSDAFVSIEYIDENTVHVYTNISSGIIVGVF